MLNTVALMGRLTADPQLKQTPSGYNVTAFCLACDRGRKDANGQSQADFIDVTAWDKTAEFVCRYFAKGSLIAVEGRLQTRNYQDRSGNNRKAVEVVAERVFFTGEGARRAPQAPVPAPQPGPAVPATDAGDDDFVLIGDGEDLPF